MTVIETYLHDKFIEWGIRFVSVVDRADTNDVANKKKPDRLMVWSTNGIVKKQAKIFAGFYRTNVRMGSSQVHSPLMVIWLTLMIENI